MTFVEFPVNNKQSYNNDDPGKTGNLGKTVRVITIHIYLDSLSPV